MVSTGTAPASDLGLHCGLSTHHNHHFGLIVHAHLRCPLHFGNAKQVLKGEEELVAFLESDFLREHKCYFACIAAEFMP